MITKEEINWLNTILDALCSQNIDKSTLVYDKRRYVNHVGSRTVFMVDCQDGLAILRVTEYADSRNVTFYKNNINK